MKWLIYGGKLVLLLDMKFHGFDDSGARYADGNLVDWWTSGDLEHHNTWNFSRRSI
jgi:endothelin-converting enzyme/putative endopeptidase